MNVGSPGRLRGAGGRLEESRGGRGTASSPEDYSGSNYWPRPGEKKCLIEKGIALAMASVHFGEF